MRNEIAIARFRSAIHSRPKGYIHIARKEYTRNFSSNKDHTRFVILFFFSNRCGCYTFWNVPITRKA